MQADDQVVYEHVHLILQENNVDECPVEAWSHIDKNISVGSSAPDEG